MMRRSKTVGQPGAGVAVMPGSKAVCQEAGNAGGCHDAPFGDVRPRISNPLWEGRSGNVGYLAKMFPRISETFILREVLALKRHGIPVRIYSLLPPTRDHRMHREAKGLLPEVEILPDVQWSNLGGFLADLLRSFKAAPGATAREVVRVLLRPRRTSRRRFFRAVTLAVRLRRDRIAHLHAAWAHTPASVARIAARLIGIPWSMGAHAKDIHLSKTDSLIKKMASARFTLTCTRANRELLEGMLSAAVCASGRGALQQTHNEGVCPGEGETFRPGEQDTSASPILMLYHGVDTAFFSPTDGAGARACLSHSESAGAAHATTLSQQTIGGKCRPAEADPSNPLILSVGRLVPKKGFDVLVRSAALLRERGVPFRMEIVGPGPLHSSLVRQIESLGLGGVVVLRGMLVLEEVRSAYERAACMVLASRITPEGDRDGIPNTLAEAMACGLPVVATRLPSIQELVVHTKTGLLVPPGDPPALADALERLLRDPALRCRLGQTARRRVRREFNAETWGKRVAVRFESTPGIEKLLYVSADRGVPVRGAKGASIHVRSVVRALRDKGVGTVVLTTRRGPGDGPEPLVTVVESRTRGLPKRLVGRVCRWARGGPPLERALLRLLDNICVYREGLCQARTLHPDLIYERYALTSVAGSFLARRLGIPHILEVNAPLAEEEAQFRGLRLAPLARWMEGWVLRRAHRVVVVSRALEEHSRRLGVRPERIVVLPNAIDPHLFHPNRDGVQVRERYRLDGDFVIGFSGTLKPWHGLHHLLRALAEAVRAVPTARLLVIGDGPGRESLLSLARHLALEDRVCFAGSVPHEEVGEFLAACDVLVAPYGPLENHWFSPIKVAEYLAVGRPVIASAIGQLRESLGPARGTVLVPPGDEESLGTTLAELAGDPQRRERLARAAVSAPPWTWDHVVRRVLKEAEVARREIWRWKA